MKISNFKLKIIMQQDVQEAIKVLKSGGIVIFPTDTAFGIGCRVDDEKAVKRLFRIRQRPKNQAMSVLVDTVTMAEKYVLPIPKEVIDKLVEPYWPGALTIVLPVRVENVPKLVCGGGNTLGVRIPNHHIARAIIYGTGVGILGPSANFHGKNTPYRFEDLDKQLVKLVDYVVPGECFAGNVSTVIDCTQTPWKIIREGAVKLDL